LAIIVGAATIILWLFLYTQNSSEQTQAKGFIELEIGGSVFLFLVFLLTDFSITGILKLLWKLPALF
jgi:hypothetical protein